MKPNIFWKNKITLKNSIFSKCYENKRIQYCMVWPHIVLVFYTFYNNLRLFLSNILKRSTRLRPRPFLSLLSVLFFYQVRILCETFPKYGIRRPWVIQGTISDTKMNVMLNKEEIKNLISVSSLISTLQIFCNVLVPFWNVWFWDRVQCSCKINDIMIFVGKGEAALLSQTHLQTTG